MKQQDILRIICRSIKSPYQKINQSVIIDPDFAIHVFCDVDINTIVEYILKDFIENMRKMDIEQCQCKPPSLISVLHLVMSLLLLV